MPSESPVNKKLQRKAKSLSDLKPSTSERLPKKKASRSTPKSASGGKSTPSTPNATRKVSSAPCSPVYSDSISSTLDQLVKIYETITAPGGRRTKSTNPNDVGFESNVTRRTCAKASENMILTEYDASVPNSTARGLELRLAIKYCNELKKVVGKKGAGRSALLAKKSPNVTLILRLTKVFNDFTLTSVVFDILRKLTSTTTGISQLAKRNVTILLFEYFHIVCETLVDPAGENIITEILQFICTLAKYDSKVPMYSRIRGTCLLLTRIACEWSLPNQNDMLQVAMNALSIFAQNDNNAITIFKSDIMFMVKKIVKNHQSQSAPSETLFFALQLLSNLALIASLRVPITATYRMSELLNLYKKNSDGESRITVLKIMKECVSTDAGKQDFVSSGVPAVLYESMEDVMQQTDNGKTCLMMNAILAVLKASINLIELPYLDDMRLSRRTFNIPIQERNATTSPSNSTVATLPSIEDHPDEFRFCLEMTMGRYRKVKPFVPAVANSIVKFRHPNLVLPHRFAESVITEPVYERPRDLLRTVMYRQMAYTMNAEGHRNLLVYDAFNGATPNDCNNDRRTLHFDSSFESGNLQKVIKISDTIYDLIIDTDVNTNFGRHNQWFFFSVCGMEVGCSYTFNIINMSKPDGQFNYGMQPVMYSTRTGRWCRAGHDICYYKNHYQKSSSETFATLTFTYMFPHADDTCYFAYHYPYTYNDLQLYFTQLLQTRKASTIMHHQVLCKTLAGNNCDLLTITAFEGGEVPLSDRKYVLLTSRVHPGESNASWIMKGLIEFLTGNSDSAVKLRGRLVFKIVPMLNPDGVINGSHRCSLAGADLNRQWREPSKLRTPTIYWTKKLWENIAKQRTVLLSCDFHGHSRRKNIFLFGCENGGVNTDIEKILPKQLDLVAPSFAFSSCKFAVEKSKRSTARVAIWKEFQIPCSYTLESSYCGPDVGLYKGQQFTTDMLEDMGRQFCLALLPTAVAIEQGPYDLHQTQESPQKISRTANCQTNEDDDDDS